MQKIGDIPNTRADIHGEFTDGNVAGGVPPTILPAEWFNTLQRELVEVVQEGGLALDPNDDTQILAALRKLFLQSDNSFSEIKAAGPDAIATALANLGLSDITQLSQLTGVVGTSRNARMSVTAALATATFTASELIVQEGLGGRQYKLTSFNKTINLATTGAGGMDTGTAPVNGFVALYAIYNPTTQVSALLAVNATSSVAPEVYGGGNMPFGYTASALVSVWGTVSSLLKIGFLSGRHVSVLPVNAYTATVGTVPVTPFSLSTVVPFNAICVDVSMGVGQTTSGSGVGMSIFSSSTGIAQIGSTAATSGATSSSGVTGTLPLIEPQRLYYSMSNATVGSYNVACRGYEF
ncbi:tail fiber protein [Yersinia massiliensis]|nr:tail fiber protein [Yersinia massiliensis]